MKPVLWMATLGLLSAAPAYAQDAVKVDPKHYKVELETIRCACFASTTGPARSR